MVAGRKDSIEEDILLWQGKLNSPRYSRNSNPLEWAALHRFLGNDYQRRLRGDRAENIETAIQHYELALEVNTRAAYAEEWASLHANLGLAYSKRVLGVRGKNLTDAIRHGELALEVFTRNDFPEEWATVHNNVGIAYLDLVRGDEADNLRRAKTHLEASLEVRTRASTPADWAQTHLNLGKLYGRWPDGDPEDAFELSIEHSLLALEVYTREKYPRNWSSVHMNLGATYRKRRRGERSANVKCAIDHYLKAIEARPLQEVPLDRCRVFRNVGNLQFEERCWAEALDAYTNALETANALLQSARSDASRLAEINQSWGLHTLSAYCMLRLGDLEGALLRLEQGKTRQLYRGRVSSCDDAEQKLRHAKEASGALQLTVPEILDLIPESGALIFPLVTPQGSAAIVLPSGTAKIRAEHVAWIDGFAESNLKALLMGTEDDPGIVRAWFSNKARGMFPSGGFRGISQRGLTEILESLLARLWEQLMGPLYERLTSLGVRRNARIILIPQGGLGLLPLHAAWCYEGAHRCTWCDKFCVSYAPSAWLLRTCRHRVTQQLPLSPSLLAIVDPTQDLPYARAEGEVVKRLFAEGARSVLVGAEATREAVIHAAAGRTFLHFACHAYFWPGDAAKSGLVVAGDGTRAPFSGVPDVPLTIPQSVVELLGLTSDQLPVNGVSGDAFKIPEIIAELNVQESRLVTLSACESGLTQAGPLADESIGLPVTFLQAGACGVVSTLWQVDDLSTMLVIETFYQETLAGTEMAEALRRAQLGLRNLTAGELAMRFRAERDADIVAGVMSYEETSKAWRRFAALDSKERPFEHPFYWAPFILTGA